MGPRLLSLLSDVEAALVHHGATAVTQPAQRSVSFHKGLARTVFHDGTGSITLQNFTLAEGQICVRATFAWAGTTVTNSQSIYPRDTFDWASAADAIAMAWLRGHKNSAQTSAATTDEANSSMESIEATG